MFAANYEGLKKRETYDEIVEYLQYGQEIIKYPDRRAKQLRESPQLSNLLDGDGSGLMEMEEEQDMAMKNQQVERAIRGAAKKNKLSAQLLRSNVRQLVKPEHFDIASDYESAVNKTASEYEYFLEEQKKGDDDKRGRGAGAVQMSLEEAVKPERRALLTANNIRSAASTLVNIIDFGLTATAATLDTTIAVASGSYQVASAVASGSYQAASVVGNMASHLVAVDGSSTDNSSVVRRRINKKRAPSAAEALAASKSRWGNKTNKKDKK